MSKAVEIGECSGVQFLARVPPRASSLPEGGRHYSLVPVDQDLNRSKQLESGFCLDVDGENLVSRAMLVLSHDIGVLVEGEREKVRLKRGWGKSRQAFKYNAAKRRKSNVTPGLHSLDSITLTSRTPLFEAHLFPWPNDPTQIEGGHVQMFRNYQRKRLTGILSHEGVDNDVVVSEFIDSVLEDHILYPYLIVAGIVMVVRNDVRSLQQLEVVMDMMMIDDGNRRDWNRQAMRYLQEHGQDVENMTLLGWTEGSINGVIFEGSRGRPPGEITAPIGSVIKKTLSRLTAFSRTAPGRVLDMKGQNEELSA